MVWCGVVCGGGLLPRGPGVVSPPCPLWHGVASGLLAVAPPCLFGSALGVWHTQPFDDNVMMMGTVITIIIINSNILMFLWLVVGRLLSTCLVTIIALLIVGRLSS